MAISGVPPFTPDPHLRLDWTLYLDDNKLMALVEALRGKHPLVKMRVKPSGSSERPHQVKLTVRGAAADGMEAIKNLDQDLQRFQIR